MCRASCLATPPNIIVILSDDQGFADLSLNPDHKSEVSTPHIDALAANGSAVFSNAYISAPICAPSRAGLMLGRYQQRAGIYTDGDGSIGMDPRIPIFPAFLPEGYASTVLGKWHLGFDADPPDLRWHALSRGFDEWWVFIWKIVAI